MKTKANNLKPMGHRKISSHSLLMASISLARPSPSGLSGGASCRRPVPAPEGLWRPERPLNTSYLWGRARPLLAETGNARAQGLLRGVGFGRLPQTFPHSSVGKESIWKGGDQGSIPESGSSPGKGNGNPLQNSGLENPMDRGAWQATVHGVSKELDTTEQLTLSLFQLSLGILF